MVWALLPLKDFVNAKQRLSGVLAPHERRHFFQAMVEDVLDVLAGHEAITQTLIVSDDPSAKLLAEHYAVKYWPEQSLAGTGLNGVVSTVAQRLQRQGVDSLLVVHGDLPLLSADQLNQLIAAHVAAPAVTLAPDRHGQGSNCMLCSPPAVVDFHYGEQSYQQHQAACADRGVRFNALTLPGIACDIDTPEDLMVLLECGDREKKSIRYLHEQGIAQRLRAMSIGIETIENSAQREQTL